MEEIIIEKKENKILVCVLEKGIIVEKYQFDFEETSTIGNMYIGTIEEILDGMQACFVDIGLRKKAFLSLKDAMPKVDLSKNFDLGAKQLSDKQNKISTILKRGQKVLVQIRKESFEDKGPRVSTHITLAGNYLVLMPETDIVTISQKIEEHKEKERLLEIVKEILPNNFGCIIRTDSIGISNEDIRLDLEQLLKKWEEIQKKFSNLINLENLELKENRLIYNDNEVIQKIARDMIRKTTKKIYSNNQKIYKELQENVSEELLEFQENENFIDKFGLKTELDRSDNRKIWLKCGAQIVIDKTEALTAIDVNSSRCIGKNNLEETIFKVNQEAAIEIMKQIRLKDIGGIIIIDFIDMYKQEYKDAILDLMRKEQKKDRSKIEVKDFTQLNLVEMTRKKCM